jgi:hypothetical protein
VRLSWGAAFLHPVPTVGPATHSPLAITAPVPQATQVRPSLYHIYPRLSLPKSRVRHMAKDSASQSPPRKTGHGLQGTQVMGGEKRGWMGDKGKGMRRGRRKERRRTAFIRLHLFSSGTTCSEMVTACHSEPCFNGGSCSPSPEGYSCTCPPSHTGPQCKTITDHCVSGECPWYLGVNHGGVEELGRVRHISF